MNPRPLALRSAALTAILIAAGLLAGCEDSGLSPSSRGYAPIPPETLALMEAKGTAKSAPTLIRAYKKESELEIWKMKADGRYALFKTYPICRWSGQLGPKLREGDRQAPEGFYSITPAQMNPNSAYYLSFNIGYPNAYDRAWDRAGGSIMVHGVCSSAGCFSMTDPQIGEIYAIARESFAGGQRAVQMQSYPFKMTAENLAKYRLDPNIAFWKQLKEGADNFEVTKQEVKVGVCDKRYVFNAAPADGSKFEGAAPCPPLKRDEAVRNLVAAKDKEDNAKIAELSAQGVRPVRTIYADGGQHSQFASRFPDVSRPEALAQGPVDVALDESKGKKARLSPAAQLAGLRTKAPTSALAQAAPGNPADVTGTIAEPAKPQSSFLGRWFGVKPAAETAPSAKSSPAAPGPSAAKDAPGKIKEASAGAVKPASPAKGAAVAAQPDNAAPKPSTLAQVDQLRR